MSNLPPSSIPLEKLAQLLSDPARWAILLELAKGEPLPVKELARRVGRTPDMTSKHMAVFRAAGVAVVGYGRLYQLAPGLRPEPGSTTLDLGHCLLKLDTRQ